MIYRRGDDTWTVFSVNAAPIQAQDGHIVAAVSTFHDISERKILEAETTQLNTRLEHLVSDGTISVAASCGWTTFTVELPVSSIRC